MSSKPFGLRRNLIALALLAGLACSNRGGRTLSVSTADERAVLGTIACGRKGPIVDKALSAGPAWADVAKLRKALQPLTQATEDHPALAQETLLAFASNVGASELGLSAADFHCSDVSLVNMKDVSEGKVRRATAFSRVAFNQHGTQALVLVTSASGNPGGMGSSDSFLFLTRPVGVWVVVGWVPWSIA